MSSGTGTDRLDLIVCDGCSRRFATYDGPGMIASITGPCPDCGGRFRLADHTEDEDGQERTDRGIDGISYDVTRLYESAFGHRPSRVRTYVQPEFAVCVLGEMLTAAERAELARGRADEVAATRRKTIEGLDPDLLRIVGDRVDRQVLSHLVRVNVAAEVTVHFFLFDDGSVPSDDDRP